jgi:hypothetical protein
MPNNSGSADPIPRAELVVRVIGRASVVLDRLANMLDFHANRRFSRLGRGNEENRQKRSMLVW